MSIIILIFFALLVAALLGTAVSNYIRFVKLCRLVAVAENTMPELNSTDGLDGNSANPFEREQFSRIKRDFFLGYKDPEIELLAAKIKRGMITIYWAFGFIFLVFVLMLLKIS